MSRKLKETVYLTLEPNRFGYASKGEPRDVLGYRVSGIRKNPPPTKSSEIAIKLELVVDSSLFEEYIPGVLIEIDERSVMPRVEVTDPSEEDTLSE